MLLKVFHSVNGKKVSLKKKKLSKEEMTIYGSVMVCQTLEVRRNYPSSICFTL